MGTTLEKELLWSKSNDFHVHSAALYPFMLLCIDAKHTETQLPHTLTIVKAVCMGVELLSLQAVTLTANAYMTKKVDWEISISTAAATESIS